MPESIHKNMFPHLVLERLYFHGKPLSTEAFYDIYRNTVTGIFNKLKNPQPYIKQDTKRKLFRMHQRGLIQRIESDIWLISEDGVRMFRNKKYI